MPSTQISRTILSDVKPSGIAVRIAARNCASESTIAQLWAHADRPGVRAFFLSIAALGIALMLALYSGAAAEVGHSACPSRLRSALCWSPRGSPSRWCPILAKRTPLRWIGYKMEYRITREGWIYIGGIIIVALAALNTGNNLLFLILASLIAIILMSGILSSITLTGVEMRLRIARAHLRRAKPVRAHVELENEKLTLPSFSLRVEGRNDKEIARAAALLETPVYFPYLPKRERVQQNVPMTFPRRGAYRQDTFRIVTRFPFGFLQKARRVELRRRSAGLSVGRADRATFFEILPALQGALESLSKGGGQDLYALRDYVPTDSARHVHWKASARLGSLMVREFTREDDCRVSAGARSARSGSDAATSHDSSAVDTSERFERAVTLCASIAWHFLRTQRAAAISQRRRWKRLWRPRKKISSRSCGILRSLQPLPRRSRARTAQRSRRFARISSK